MRIERAGALLSSGDLSDSLTGLSVGADEGGAEGLSSIASGPLRASVRQVIQAAHQA